ncbi:hypothetical protein [Tenacibaculum sp. C7A-26P2]|uniref:hypothetical protein n=1 Tax=Tenacibaculum sp. C7A-26P2 TaxID=3447504 RepID=UPI003F86C0D5
MNTSILSKRWFNFSFENTEKAPSTHTAIYFSTIDACNRLKWKQKFSFRSKEPMEAIGNELKFNSKKDV